MTRPINTEGLLPEIEIEDRYGNTLEVQFHRRGKEVAITVHSGHQPQSSSFNPSVVSDRDKIQALVRELQKIFALDTKII